jgi:hypothetical protein
MQQSRMSLVAISPAPGAAIPLWTERLHKAHPPRRNGDQYTDQYTAPRVLTNTRYKAFPAAMKS